MRSPRLLSPLALVAGLVVSSCAKDSVGVDVTNETECGNGVLEQGEECDVDSPGCQQCVIVPNWTCDANGCAQVCGDGVVPSSGASGCQNPQRDTECDVTGWWAGRETDYTRDSVLGSVQTSSTWYLYHFQQSGDDFHVVDQLECGIHVTGSAVVDGTPGTLRGLMWANRMDAASPHGARHGTSKRSGAGCAVTFDRWYRGRGITDAYLPVDFSTSPPLSSLPDMPSVASPVTSTDFPAGATDPDGDGIPGAAFAITGFVNGVRDAAQRDWKEFATPAGESVPLAGLVLAIQGAFDVQENVLRVTGCGGACALIASAAHAATDLHGRLTLSFIGKTFGSDRVSRVVAGVPRKDMQTDLTTCANVRLVLPHDPTVPKP